MEMREAAGHLDLTVEVFRENGHYVARCPELDVASFGRSEDEAFRSAGDAIQLYLFTLTEVGELHHVLKERDLEIRWGAHSYEEGDVEVRVRLAPGQRQVIEARSFPVPAGA
jgi:predicted RNase H-like HicB family nuclease